MARVSRFTEEFNLTYTPTPGLETQITMADEKAALISTTKSEAEPKKTYITPDPIKGLRRLATYYKRHFNQLVACNLRQASNHHDSEDIEAGSISSAASSYGARMASEAELKRQSERNHLDYIFYLGPDDDESSTFNSTAFKANKPQPTIAVTKAQATAEPRCPDGPTLWAQVYRTTGYKSEIERINENTKAAVEALGITETEA